MEKESFEKYKIFEQHILPAMDEYANKKIEEYKEAFKVLRTQFLEMQVFNAKLAYVNKLLLNTDYTKLERINICEQFDSVNTMGEIKKLYESF